MAAFVSVKENKWVRARVISERREKERTNQAADNVKGRSQREEDKKKHIRCTKGALLYTVVPVSSRSGLQNYTNM